MPSTLDLYVRQVGSLFLVGGLSTWPGLLQPLEARLRAERPHHMVLQHNPAAEPNPDRTMDGLICALRSRIEAANSPVTVVAQSLDATLVLALALADPSLMDAVVLHEPLVGRAEPGLAETANHAADQLCAAADPVAGVQTFAERLMGTDTWSRLHPNARGYMRHHAVELQQLLPLVARWSPLTDRVEPSTTTFVSAGAGSAPMWHRAAQAVSGERGPHRSLGRGHLLSVDDPQALLDLILVATDAAEARSIAA